MILDLADVKRQLRVTTDADDQTLKDLIDRGVEFVERESGFYYGVPKDHTEYLRGNGTDTIFLSDNIATAPTSIKERPYPGGTDTTILPADTDGYVVRDGRGLRRKAGVWYYGYEYEVTYKRGYTSKQAPGWVEQAVIRFVKLHYLPEGVTSGLQSETIRGYSYTVADAADQQAEEASLLADVRSKRRLRI